MLANESTFENWQAQLATKITRSSPTEQSTTFRLLAAFLQKATPEVVAGFVKTLGSENDAKGPHMISLKLLAFLEETVGGLYTSTEESVKAMFVTKQPIFIEAFGDAVQFLPSPASMQQNMLDKLLEVGLPTLQMQTLASMSKLLKKDADDRASQSLKKTYQIESLAFTTIQFIAWDKANVVPAEYPLQAMASDVELASKMVEEVVAAHSNIKELEEGLKETIKQYICQFVVNAVFQRFSSFFTKVKDSENAIPQHFEQHMETKNVAQLKATVFSKKTHMATTANIESYVAITESLSKVIKSAAHFSSGQVLGQMKNHETSLRALRTYSVSVHAANLLINKLPGSEPKQKAAKLRELLNKPSAFLFVVELWVFFWGCGCNFIFQLHVLMSKVTDIQ